MIFAPKGQVEARVREEIGSALLPFFPLGIWRSAKPTARLRRKPQRKAKGGLKGSRLKRSNEEIDRIRIACVCAYARAIACARTHAHVRASLNTKCVRSRSKRLESDNEKPKPKAAVSTKVIGVPIPGNQPNTKRRR